MDYPVTTKVKEIIGDEVCMGTYGIVEIEVRKLEAEIKQLRKALEGIIGLCPNTQGGEMFDIAYAALTGKE